MKNTPEFLITSPHPCSYLDNKQAQTVFLSESSQPNTQDYSILVRHGFRRSGEHIYRPSCNNCNACISVRLNVNAFAPKRTFKRIIKRNADLTITHYLANSAPDVYSLYEKYIAVRHKDGDMYPANSQQYDSFLKKNLGNSEFLVFHLKGIPVAVAVTDVLSDGLAAVYTFFDCDLSSRSLGSMAILYQIEYCQRLNLPYLYLGYWIRDCEKMRYKTAFQPLEYFVNDRWLSDLPYQD